MLIQLQGKCDQLKKCLDEQSADNEKQKELVEQLRAECSELKEVRLIRMYCQWSIFIKCLCSESTG